MTSTSTSTQCSVRCSIDFEFDELNSKVEIQSEKVSNLVEIISRQEKMITEISRTIAKYDETTRIQEDRLVELEMMMREIGSRP
jgi:hypothetical protein